MKNKIPVVGLVMKSLEAEFFFLAMKKGAICKKKKPRLNNGMSLKLFWKARLPEIDTNTYNNLIIHEN